MALLFTSGCNENCECYAPPDPFRLVILDQFDKNRLDPKYPDAIKIDMILFSTGKKLDYTITDSIDHEFPINFFFLFSNDNALLNNCNGTECELYISYLNRIEVDTLNILRERVQERNSDGCQCLSHPTRYIKLNGIEIKEFEVEHKTGAAIIRKN